MMKHRTRLTPLQFDLACRRTYLRHGRARAAAKLYLVDGITLREAGRQAGGITHQAVQQAVSKVRVAADLDSFTRDGRSDG